MTDDELIVELRNSKGWPNLGNAAADRIEQLLESIKGLSQTWATAAVNREVSEGKLADIWKHRMEMRVLYCMARILVRRVHALKKEAQSDRT